MEIEDVRNRNGKRFALQFIVHRSVVLDKLPYFMASKVANELKSELST